MNGVGEWLERLGLGRYVETFTANDIDEEVVAGLTDQDLRELGVASLGHRKKLLKAIALLDPQGRGVARDTAPAAPASGTRVHAEAEHRHLTVMFCDLVGSTALAGRIDPEDYREAIGAFQAAAATAIERYEGFIARYMGDGLLVYFGYPRAHEDDAERAVRAGLGIVDAIGRLAPVDDVELQVRVGIASGPVIAGDLIGEGASEEWAVLGETPNLAARLQAVAEPGTVTVADGTRELCPGLFEYVDLGLRELRGLRAPARLWGVVSELAVESRFDATHRADLTPLIGREGDLALLEQHWAQAKGGEGRVLVLSGEPGIGKSRLVRTFRERIAGEPHVELRYQCSPHHSSSAFYPIIEQLRRAAGFTVEEGPGSRLDKLEALIARSSPDVAEAAPLLAALLSLPSGTRYPPLDLSAQRQRERTIEALAAQVSGLAREQPVLVEFEDAQWADPTSLEVLTALFAAILDEAVLALVTHRPEFEPPWKGYDHLCLHSLARLGRRQGESMVEHVVGGESLPAQVRAEIVEKTDGVPLFLEELTKAVLESGAPRRGVDALVPDRPARPHEVPDTLQDSLMARLDRLGPAKELAQVGAVIGRRFSQGLLGAVSSLDEATLQRTLAELCAAGLIYRRGTPPEATYTFKHALVQDTAYSSLLRARRQMLHARVAKELARRRSKAGHAEPELLAHHYCEAGLIDEAVACWLEASEAALDRSAHLEANAQLTRGLELLHRLPASLERDRMEFRLRGAWATATRHDKGYTAPEVSAALNRAHELAPSMGESPEVLPVLNNLVQLHAVAGRIELAHELAKECMERAERLGEPSGLVCGHKLMGQTSLYLGKLTGARMHLEKALGLYDSRRDASSAIAYLIDHRAGTLSLLAETLFPLGFPDQARARLEEAQVHAEALGHLQTVAIVLHKLNYLDLHERESDRVRRRARRLIALAREQRYSYWEVVGRLHRGCALAQQGEFDAASEDLGLWRTSPTLYETAIMFPVFMASLAVGMAEAGRHDEAMKTLRDAWTLTERTHERWYLAELHRIDGELRLRLGAPGAAEAAEACMLQAIEIARRQEAKQWELRASTSLARLWSDAGRRGDAAALLAPVYEWFTEGFGTADLSEAGALLGSLS